MNNFDCDTEPKNDKKKLWLKILWYVFLFPIAITVYIVKNKKMNNVTKGIVISIIWILFLVIAMSNTSSNKKNTESNSGNVGQVTIEEKDNDNFKLDDTNKDKSADNSGTFDDNSKNPMELSMGDVYDDNGVKITLESLEKLDNSNKLKVKIENGSFGNYHLSELNFEFWTLEGVMLTYVAIDNSDAFSSKDISPGESFECNIFRQPGDVSYITYAINARDHKLNPKAKWIIKKDTRTQEEKDEESKNASNKAQEAFKNLVPYPTEVKFPFLDYAVERAEGGFYQHGYLKYKNAYGNKVKAEYRMWYSNDGTLNKAELDGRTLK